MLNKASAFLECLDLPEKKEPFCQRCRAERAQRVGRHGSEALPPPDADPTPSRGRQEDGEIVGESPSTSKRDASQLTNR